MKINKFLFSIIVTLLLITSIQPGYAQGPTGTWASGITCQNLDTVNNANISINFYDTSGNLALSYPDVINAGGTVKYFTTSTPAGLPTDFIGGAQISSDVKIACNVNTQTTGTGTTTNPYRIGTNAGLSDTESSTQMYGPQVMKNLGGTWNSYIAVQNTTGAGVSGTITYRGQSGSIVTTENFTIPANSSYISYQKDNPNLPNGFVGSAVIAATSPTTTKLAVIVNFYNDGSSYNSSQFHSYTAFNDGSDVLFVPRLVRKFYGYNGGLTIQNIGSVNTAVKIDFNFAGTIYSYTTPSITSGAAIVLYLPNLSELAPVDLLLMKDRVGSAKVTALEAGSKIVAIINEDNRGNAADNNGAAVPVERIGQGSTYNAILNGQQNLNLFFVQITNKAGGIFSGGFQISNTTSSNATCNFSFVGDTDANFSDMVPANGSRSYYAPNVTNLNVGFNAGLFVVCDQQVVGIGNLAAEPGTGKYGDSFTQSNGLNN